MWHGRGYEDYEFLELTPCSLVRVSDEPAVFMFRIETLVDVYQSTRRHIKYCDMLHSKVMTIVRSKPPQDVGVSRSTLGPVKLTQASQFSSVPSGTCRVTTSSCALLHLANSRLTNRHISRYCLIAILEKSSALFYFKYSIYSQFIN